MTLIATILVITIAATAARLATAGTWRRFYVRARWGSIARSVGAAVRRDRLVTRKRGPGEKVSLTAALEHVPLLLGLVGRPIGGRGRPIGVRWSVWAAQGSTTSELANLGDRFAATTWCARGIIERRSPRRADLLLIWRDPLTTPRPWAAVRPNEITAGWDLTGDWLTLPTLESWGGHWLIGGSSGSGKSGWVNAILGQLIGQGVEAHGVDPKLVELGPWEPALASLAVTPDQAARTVRQTEAWVMERLKILAAHGLREVPAGHPELLRALVIDELATLISGRKHDDDPLVVSLVKLAQLGRAAGLLLVCATQRPSGDAVPASLRDQLGRRVLTRPANLDGGRVVTGVQPTQAEVDQLDRPGIAWVHLPGRRPVLARSTWADVAEVERYAAAHPYQHRTSEVPA